MTFAVLALAGALAAQSGSLEDASKAFDDAQQHHDKQVIESFLAPDFQYVTRKGLRLGRSAFIAVTTSPDEVLEPFIIKDHRVLELGSEGGIASGEAIINGSEEGKPVSDHFRFADVFARRAGRWVVVYTQVTALP